MAPASDFLDATPDNFPKDKDKPDGLRSKSLYKKSTRSNIIRIIRAKYFNTTNSIEMEIETKYTKERKSTTMKIESIYLNRQRNVMLHAKESKKEYDKQYRDKNKVGVTKTREFTKKRTKSG